MLYRQITDAWYDYHQRTRGFKPTAFTNREGKVFKKLIERLTNAVKEKRPDYTDDDVLGAFNFVLRSIETSTNRELTWYKNKSILIIESQLDSILTVIRQENGRAQSKQSAEQKIRNRIRAEEDF